MFQEITSSQYYDKKENQFLSDRYITGECPCGKNKNAYGDQCEVCGKTLSPMDLKNPKSSLSGNSPTLEETKNWYLPMDKLCLLYTSPSPRDGLLSRMPSSA